MANTSVGGRTADANGLSLMASDSHTASNNFGLNGAQFTNIPKQKFLFYIKFFRPDADGGNTWENGVGVAIKNIDRPRVSFKQETLNQYNRKRVVQTGHEFEPLQLKFHDTVNPALRNMFVQYYQYYYGDSAINNAGPAVYDIVTGEGYEIGKWGFHPQDNPGYGYFFSHISVYQLYNGLVERFDLVNPKISSYNPDDFDYSVGNVANEIQMSIDFEGIVYAAPEELSPALAQEMGIDRGQYWNVPNDYPAGSSPGLALDPNAVTSSLGSTIGNVALNNLRSLITGQGTQSIGGILGSISGAYDANRGLAVGQVGLKSIKDLVSGNTSSAKQGVQGLLKGALFGKPGKLF